MGGMRLTKRLFVLYVFQEIGLTATEIALSEALLETQQTCVDVLLHK